MGERARHVGALRLVGACYVLGGLLVLLDQLGVASVRWSLVLPTVLVALGAVVLVAGVANARVARPSAPR